MKLYFNYETSYKEIYFDEMIFFHGNIDNQIKLYDVIKEGLQGSSKTFLLNNSIIKKKELNVIEFSMNNIFDDLKFTSKSYNLKILQSLFDNDNMNLDNYNELLKGIQSQFDEKYQVLSNYYHIKPNLRVNDLKKLILDNFYILNKDEVNISMQIELEFAIIANYVSLNSDKDFYILVKHFDYCLDISQMKRIISLFSNAKNIQMIFFTKSFKLYDFFREDYQNYLIGNHNIYKYELDKSIINFNPILTDQENMVYQNILRKAQIYNDYCQITNEKIIKY